MRDAATSNATAEPIVFKSNQRPRKILGFESPAERLSAVLQRSIEPAAQSRHCAARRRMTVPDPKQTLGSRFAARHRSTSKIAAGVRRGAELFEEPYPRKRPRGSARVVSAHQFSLPGVTPL